MLFSLSFSRRKLCSQKSQSSFISIIILNCRTTVFSHSQTVVVCGNCQTVLCQPTGGRARLNEGSSFRKKGDWAYLGSFSCCVFIIFPSGLDKETEFPLYVGFVSTFDSLNHVMSLKNQFFLLLKGRRKFVLLACWSSEMSYNKYSFLWNQLVYFRYIFLFWTAISEIFLVENSREWLSLFLPGHNM